jgi:hypothetical protein
VRRNLTIRVRTTLAIVATALLFAAAPATSQAAPIVWNQTGSTSCLSWYMGYDGYCYERMKNGTKFRMSCWADARYATRGNYSSRRWFHGQSQRYGYWGWMHASYVYYQVVVKRC